MTKKHILIGVTGSVATIKIYNLIRDVKQIFPLDSIEIQIVGTKSSLHFFDTKKITERVYLDEDEWKDYTRGDPVLHIELRKWADVFMVAPLDANSLGKLANGICDNLLTCVLRAWDPLKPLILVPAMNTAMWEHPITLSQITTINSWGFVRWINPIAKLLACGDLGVGAMAETNDIATKLHEILNQTKSDIIEG